MSPDTTKPYHLNDPERGESIWPKQPEKEKKMPEDMTKRTFTFTLYSEENVDGLLHQLPKEMRGDYIEALRQVVKGPGVGGSGQYLGSLEPLVFATKAQKLEAIKLLNRWNEDSYNK